MAKTKLFYTEKELPQRSEKWHSVRETCIGGSDAGTVLGLTSKYGEKPQTLWKRKTKRLKPKKFKAIMERGALMEGEAAAEIIKYLKTDGVKNPKITPFFAKHPEFPFLGISFDGVDIKNKFITEIKCPSTPWMFRSVFTDGIQDYYLPQVQLQLHVANAIWGITKAYYCSYYPDGAYILDTTNYVEYLKKLAVIDIDYDPVYCTKIMKVIKKFWTFVDEDRWDEAEFKKELKKVEKLRCKV